MEGDQWDHEQYFHWLNDAQILLSMIIAEWSISLVGCKIWERKNMSQEYYINSSLGWWVSKFNRLMLKYPIIMQYKYRSQLSQQRGEGTLGIPGWGWATRTLELLAYTRASFSWILLPYARVNSPTHSYPRVAISSFLSLDKIFNQLVSFVENDSLF